MKYLLLIIFIFAVVKFQIYLSKKECFVYGLILPVLSFSLVMGWHLFLTPVNIEISDDFTTNTIVSEDIEGETVREELQQETPDTIRMEADTDHIQSSFLFTIIGGNAGTVILLIIYWIQRRKRTVHSELKKMQLSEL